MSRRQGVELRSLDAIARPYLLEYPIHHDSVEMRVEIQRATESMLKDESTAFGVRLTKLRGSVAALAKNLFRENPRQRTERGRVAS